MELWTRKLLASLCSKKIMIIILLAMLSMGKHSLTARNDKNVRGRHFKMRISCFLVVPKTESRRRTYNFRDQDIPILRQHRGETVELQLPVGESISSLKWISVFCRDFSVNFGQVNFANWAQIMSRFVKTFFRCSFKQMLFKHFPAKIILTFIICATYASQTHWLNSNRSKVT